MCSVQRIDSSMDLCAKIEVTDSFYMFFGVRKNRDYETLKKDSCQPGSSQK
jgi:hypothetical protein